MLDTSTSALVDADWDLQDESDIGSGSRKPTHRDAVLELDSGLPFGCFHDCLPLVLVGDRFAKMRPLISYELVPAMQSKTGSIFSTFGIA